MASGSLDRYLVEKLRRGIPGVNTNLLSDAADEIEELACKLHKAEEALRAVGEYLSTFPDGNIHPDVLPAIEAVLAARPSQASETHRATPATPERSET
jgi:hypothetical protein